MKMSNPISAALSRMSLDATSTTVLLKWNLNGFEIHPDAVLCNQDEITELNAKLSSAGSIDGTRDMLLSKANILLRPSVLMRPAVEAGMVFNPGAQTRLMAITQDSPLLPRLRTRLATLVRNLLLTCVKSSRQITTNTWGEIVNENLFTWDPLTCLARKYWLDTDAILTRGANYFMASGGTQCSLGRLKKALPARNLLVNYKPATDEEVELAYMSCGFYHGSMWQQLFPEWQVDHTSLWPVLADGLGNCVKVNRNASLGFPYLANPSNEDAQLRMLETVAAMEASESWQNDPARTYNRMMATNPGFVLFMGKTKSDVYSREKIMAGQCRFYLVTPGHLKVYMQRLLQPFAGAKVSIGDVFNLPRSDWYKALQQLHSAQKHGLTGIGPSQLLMAIEAQLEAEGVAYWHCGDDTLVAVYVVMIDEHGQARRVLLVFGLDMSNFDLTQKTAVFGKVDERLAAGMRVIDRRADLWLAVRQGRLTLVHGAGVVYMEGTGTSGIPGQSEVNDMIAEVVCSRLKKRITRRPYMGTTFIQPQRLAEARHDRPPLYEYSHAQLVEDVARIGRDTGLEIRLEFCRAAQAAVGTFAFSDSLLSDRHYLAAPSLKVHYSMGHTMEARQLSFVFLGYNFGAMAVKREGSGEHRWPQAAHALLRGNREFAPKRCDDDEPGEVTYEDMGNPYFTREQLDEWRCPPGTSVETREMVAHGRAGTPLVPPARLDYATELLDFIGQGRSLADRFGAFATAYPGIVVIPDMGRYTTNVLYANKGWVKNREEHTHYEVLRQYGMLLSSGYLFLDQDGLDCTRPAMQAILEQMRLALLPALLTHGLTSLNVPEEESALLGDLNLPRTVASLYAATQPWSFVKKLVEIWEPTAGGKLPRVAAGVARALPIPAPLIAQTISWADAGDEEDLQAIEAIFGACEDGRVIQAAHKTVMFATNLQALALRALTSKNWGRPPPSVAIRNPAAAARTSAVAGSAKTGLTASQKRNASRKRKNARDRGARDEETMDHLEDARREERERLELEADMQQSRRLDYLPDF